MTKLSDDEILTIPKLLKNRMNHADIAAKLNVSKTTIRRIIKGRSYAHIQPILQPMIEEVSQFLEKSKMCTKCNITKPRTGEFFQKINRSIGFEARCKACKSKDNKNRLDKLKIAALTIYSKKNIPTCQCCNETSIEFLTIDHIEGNGSVHRKQIKGKFSTIGQWLARNNYPVGFRTLCMNCNFSFGAFGYCPHEKS